MESGFEKVIEKALKAVNYKDSSDNKRLKAAILDFSDTSSDEGAYVASVADDAFLQTCGKAIECTPDQIDVIKDNASLVLQNSKFHTGKEYSDQISSYVVDGFLLFAGKSTLERDRKAFNVGGDIVTNEGKPVKEANSAREPVKESDKGITVNHEVFNSTQEDPHRHTKSIRGSDPNEDLEPKTPMAEMYASPEKTKKKKNRIVFATILIIFAIIGVIIVAKAFSSESQATLVENEATIAIGNEYVIKTDVVDYDELEWEISDTTVLDNSVDDKDKAGQIIVKGLSEGDAEVTVYADDTEIGTCKIQVVVPEILFNEFEEIILAQEEDNDFTDNIPIILADIGSVDTININGNDSSEAKWTSTNEDVLKLSNKTGTETTCEVVGYGFTTIKAVMNGREISKKVVVSKKGSKEVLVDRESLSISDDANVLLYCDYEADNDDVVFAAEFSDIMDITWPEDKGQGMTVLNVEKTGAGKGTIEVDLVDESGNSVANSEPAIINVICE